MRVYVSSSLTIALYYHRIRCIATKDKEKPNPEDVTKELERIKLPGKWSQWTGNVLYPDENSAIWDVTR